MNRRTAEFRAMFAKLPAQIQQAAREAYGMFLRDPKHPSLRLHFLKPTSKGQHLPGSISASITKQYRAIYVVVDGVNFWYWVGTHADYDRFAGKK